MSAMWSRIRESRAGIVATVAVIAAVLLVPFGMPVIVEALVLIVVCAVTYALVMRAAERS